MSPSTPKHCIRVNSILESVPYLESVIPENRLNYLVDMCKATLKHSPGNVLEVGVYRGGSLVRLAEAVRDVCPDFHVIGVDTFSGHPYSDGNPAHPIGKYSDVDFNELESLLQKQGLAKWITLAKGKVEDVFRSLNLQEISFAHIDCDLYTPVSFSAEAVPKVLNKEGILYFDDYGHEHCPGATRAILERFDRQDLEEVYMPDDGTCWSCHLKPGK